MTPREPEISRADIADILRDLLQELSRFNRRVAGQLGINATDLLCLGFVKGSHGPVTAKAIMDYIGISSGSTTALIDRLESRGLLERAPHPSDRRGIILRIGSAAADTGFIALRDRFRQVMGVAWQSFTPEELAIVHRFFAATIAGAAADSDAARPLPDSLACPTDSTQQMACK